MAGLTKPIADDSWFSIPQWPTDGKSVVFDNGERFNSIDAASDEPDCKHLRNNFTIAAWYKPSGAGELFEVILSARNQSSERIRMSFNSDLSAPNAQWSMIVWDDGGTLRKNFEHALLSGTWYHLVATVNANAATTDQMHLFVNGEEITPTKVTDNALADRSAMLFTDFFCGLNGGGGSWHSVAIWNKVLSAKAIRQIYNGGNETFNLLLNSGAYKKKKYLQHWWVPELSSSPDANMGRDYGRAGYRARGTRNEEINLMDEAIGVTAADDLVGDTPSGR